MDVDKERRIIVCITGLPGSGKSTVAEALRTLGFEAINLGDAIREEAVRRGLPLDSSTLGELMLEVRREHGPGAVAELSLPKIRSAASRYVVVDGVRSLSEVHVIRSIAEVRMLAVHANQQTRYRFLTSRVREDAPPSWEAFLARDERELRVGLGDAIALSDEVINNNDLTIDGLKREAVRVVRRWLKEIEDRTIHRSG